MGGLVRAARWSSLAVCRSWPTSSSRWRSSPLQHAFLGQYLGYQVGDRDAVIACVVHQLLLDAQGFLEGGYKLVADHHMPMVTLVPCYASMVDDSLGALNSR